MRRGEKYKTVCACIVLGLSTLLPETWSSHGPSSSRRSPPSAEVNGQSGRKTLHVFTSPNEVFQFKYSDQLLPCPSVSCIAYFPMCDQTGVKTLVCFGYDRSRLKGNHAFEAATFSVGVVTDAASAQECLSTPPGWLPRNRKLPLAAVIDGAKFKIMDFGEGGLGNSLDFRAYRTYHEGTCFQLSTRIATIIGGDEASVPENVRDQRLEVVRKQIGGTLHSFRFLK
jgi:hypothetical protein